jgi:hypothetical protein
MLPRRALRRECKMRMRIVGPAMPGAWARSALYRLTRRVHAEPYVNRGETGQCFARG